MRWAAIEASVIAVCSQTKRAALAALGISSVKSALIGQLLAFIFNDALTIVFDCLRGHHATLVILQLTTQFMGQFTRRRHHHIKRLFGMTRARQTEEETHGAGAEAFNVVEIKSARLQRIGHGEQHFTIARHAFVTMEDVHLAETQATFQNILQQRRAFEAFFIAGNHLDHQYFFNRWQFLIAALAMTDGFDYIVINRVKQRWHGFFQAQIKVALLRLTAAATIQFTRAQRRQVFLIKSGLITAINNPRWAEQIGIAVIIRQVGKTAVKFELDFSLTTAHPPPAIKQDAGNHNNADDNQPLAQTEFHEIP